MTRIPLPNKRLSIGIDVWYGEAGKEQSYAVHFGFDPDGFVKEAFCKPFKSGTDMQGLVNDACILISLSLQHGMSITQIAGALGELRSEGAVTGPPASVLGAIARAGVKLETE